MSASAAPEFIDDPHTAVINAIEMFRVGIALEGAIRSGRITEESFPPRVILDLGDGTGLPIPTSFDKGQLRDAATNLRNATLSTAIIAADSALDAHFRRKEPDKGRPLDRGDKRNIRELSGIESVRALLYMMRTALAHDPFDPRWEVKSENRKGTLSIPEIGIHIDTTTLHGNRLETEVWGGPGKFIQLLQMVERETGPDGWDPDSLSRRYN